MHVHKQQKKDDLFHYTLSSGGIYMSIMQKTLIMINARF